jgi:hypothetical protein
MKNQPTQGVFYMKTMNPLFVSLAAVILAGILASCYNTLYILD